jgi:hypothetical protein
MDITFGIITAGGSDHYINEIITSIENESIPNYEVIIVGSSNISSRKNTRVIPFDESVKKWWITRKKNIIAENALYETLVIAHDYFKLLPGWYAGFESFGKDFDLCMNQILNKDGTRYRDWSLFPTFLPQHLRDRRDLLLPYHIKGLERYQYFSGGYFVVNRDFMLRNPLDESLCWGDGEDVEWFERLNKTSKIVMNPDSKVYILKDEKFVYFAETEDYMLQELLKSVSE